MRHISSPKFFHKNFISSLKSIPQHKMGKVAKATKKFKSKHLKRTIDHRKEVKKHNELVSRHKKGKTGGASAEEVEARAEAARKKKDVFDGMDVEKFFDKGFEVPKAKGEAHKAKGKAHKAVQEASDEESSSEEEEHEEELAKLAEKDPEFYEYLQNNDKALLDFKPTNPLDAMSDDEEEDDEEEEEAEEEVREAKVSPAKTEITLQLVREWSKKLGAAPSVPLVKNVSIAFKAAINVNRNEEDYKYTITDGQAFQELMLVALKKLPGAVQKLAPYKVVKGARTVDSGAGSKSKKLGPVIKSHAGSLVTLLQDITNTETALLVLSSTQELLPYLLSFRRLLKQILGAIVTVWSTTRDVETQVAAFAFLNNAAREFSKSILDNVLKLTYGTFIKHCRQTSIRTMPLINFQKNSAAELFGIDATLAYQVGFEYIRQLAIHLRNSINNNKDGVKTIYNWQYVHSLDFWSRVLSVQCGGAQQKPSPLRELIYPFVQVTLGAIRLIPSATYFPLRFYLVRSLIRLSQNTGVFIPIFPLIFEILNSTTLTRNPKNANLESFDFSHNIKASQAYLGTRVYQNGVCEQVVDLIGEYFVLYCKSISFPELSTPVIIALRRYVKQSTNVKFNKQLVSLVDKLNQNNDFILKKRATVEFTPTNRAEVARFLSDLDWTATPLGEFVAVQREIREKKEALLRESLESDDEPEEAEDLEIENSGDDDSEASDSEGEDSE